MNRSVTTGRSFRRVATPGGRLFVDEADRGSVARALLARGIYEREWTRWMESVIRPGMHALDVGANIGYYTALLARLVGPEGSVMACEPDPGNAALIRLMLAENGYAHAAVVEAAVWDRVGRATLFQDSAWHGVHSLAAENCVNRGDAKVEVSTTTINALLASGRRFDFVKLDAQGAEGRILAAADALLAQPRLTVLIEIWPHGLAALGTSTQQVIDAFMSHGFSCFAMQPDRGLQPTDAAAIQARAAALGTWSSFNVVWVKE